MSAMIDGAPAAPLPRPADDGRALPTLVETGSDASAAQRSAAERTASRRDLDWRSAMEQAQLEQWFGGGGEGGRNDRCEKNATPFGTSLAAHWCAGTDGARVPARTQDATQASMFGAGRLVQSSVGIAAFGQAAQRYSMVFDGEPTASEASNEGDAARTLPVQALTSSEASPSTASFIPRPQDFRVAMAALAETLAAADESTPARPSPPAQSGSRAAREASASGIRVSAQWAADGVRIWIGIDRDADLPPATLHEGICNWLAQRGVRLAGLVCNGRAIDLPARRASPGVAPLTHDGTRFVALPHYSYFEERS